MGVFGPDTRLQGMEERLRCSLCGKRGEARIAPVQKGGALMLDLIAGLLIVGAGLGVGCLVGGGINRNPRVIKAGAVLFVVCFSVLLIDKQFVHVLTGPSASERSDDEATTVEELHEENMRIAREGLATIGTRLEAEGVSDEDLSYAIARYSDASSDCANERLNDFDRQRGCERWKRLNTCLGAGAPVIRRKKCLEQFAPTFD